MADVITMSPAGGAASDSASSADTDSPASTRARNLKAHRRMVEAQSFETDLSSMHEINHLNEQRERIANLLKGIEQKVTEEEEEEGGGAAPEGGGK